MMFDDINDEHRFMSDFVIIDENTLILSRTIPLSGCHG